MSPIQVKAMPIRKMPASELRYSYPLQLLEFYGHCGPLGDFHTLQTTVVVRFDGAAIESVIWWVGEENGRPQLRRLDRDRSDSDMVAELVGPNDGYDFV
jgi:hypothetical protein